MDMPAIPTPPSLTALASFVRERLNEVSESIAPLWRGRADGVEVVTSVRPDSAAVATARQFATVVVSAAAPFAPNAYARARLIRQLHATGLLTADEVHRVTTATAVLDGPDARPTVVDGHVVDDRPA